jgi:hypothetical protein
MATLAYLVGAVVLQRMQIGLFLAFGPSMRSRFDDDGAQLYKRFEPHRTL